VVCKTAIGGSNPPVASLFHLSAALARRKIQVIGFGTLDLALSVFYSALFVLVVVISYLSLSRRKTRS
jgi:hypothetical protein